MKFSDLLCILVLLLSVSSPEASAQTDNNLLSRESVPSFRPDETLVRLQIPLDPEYAAPDFAFTVENPKQTKIPVSLARRLFSETVRAVTSTISPSRRLKVRLLLTLRLGQKDNFVHIRRGRQEGTIMGMKNWDEVVFAALLARAVPSSILSEAELDDAARRALRRAHATISTEELQSR